MGSASAAASDEQHVVRSPFYGEVLYNFYQQKYFSALSHLMTAQHFERLGQDTDDAELLRGGLLLSYGQHVEAGEIFEKLIDKGASPAVRDRAWFYLAKIRYQRGYLPESEEALARFGGKLPGDLEDERQILHATLLMDHQQYQQAADLLSAMHGNSDWALYGRYNLGVALIKVGETEKGVLLLEQVGRTPERTEELKSLRDKANLALGFTYLQGGWSDLARTYLERVRLDGLMSNKALLGMGWAYSARDQQENALVYWKELQNRDPLDGAVQESLLAVPYALGKLGAYRQALAKYEEAITIYTREMARLDASIAAIRAGKLTALLLQGDPVEEMGWFWQLQQLPDVPESHYLAQLMAGHDFQEALKNYRDLRFMQARLDLWSSDIDTYRDMLATRRAAFAKRLPDVLHSRRVQDLSKLSAARDRYAEELASIEHDANTGALATEKEQALLDRLERIRKSLARQVDSSGEAQERYRLLHGLLTWDIATDFDARVWQARLSLNELDRQLAEAQTRRTALEKALQETPRTFDAFDVRIRALTPRIAQLRARTQELARAQEAHLGDLAVVALRQQQERLATYLTQTNFAVAQMYDQSSSPRQVPP
jgi:tetratricopeptide (TPR) repeat protein